MLGVGGDRVVCSCVRVFACSVSFPASVLRLIPKECDCCDGDKERVALSKHVPGAKRMTGGEVERKSGLLGGRNVDSEIRPLATQQSDGGRAK